MLIAAIKSLNDQTVAAVLDVTTDTANALITKNLISSYSRQRPLYIAIQWDVSSKIFAQLINHGANPSLKNSSSTTTQGFLGYYSNDWSDRKKYNRVRQLFFR